jgi:CheY-like chemotaxis protein
MFAGRLTVAAALDSLARMAVRQQNEAVRVLVVDDDAMSRDLLEMLLGEEGYVVESAESGDAALSLVKLGQAPEIVLSDIQMPGTSGKPLADGLRAACGPETLLLAMSGSGASEEAIRAFDGFLLKPFTMQQFGAAVSGEGLSLSAVADVEEIAADGDAPALDEGIYTQLAGSMKTSQLHQLYVLCINDARKRIVSLRGAVAANDAAEFVREAHSIKGGCGMIGATELYQLAAKLEKESLRAPGLAEKGAEKVNNPLDQLGRACDRLERILLARAI